MTKKGDTLIEVTIAIGIFSLIAIAIASVMSTGTAGSQNALETLITRQEVDAQADALRFIHESYVTDKNSSSNNYAKIWEAITSKAQSPFTLASPTTCQELYNSGSGEVFTRNAFIINARKLNTNATDSVVISAKERGAPQTTKFTTTGTYPRLIYSGTGDNTLAENLTSSDDNLSKAEGIYIIAVQGNDAEIISASNTNNTTSYYDFYIRSCWYGSNSDTPTTISTLIRLSDAPETNSAGPSKISSFTVNYENNYEPAQTLYRLNSPIARSTKIQENTAGALANLKDRYYRFRGWCSVPTDPGTNACSGRFYDVNDQNFQISYENSGSTTLYAVWDKSAFTINYSPGGGEFTNGNNMTMECTAFDTRCEPNYPVSNLTETPTQSGYLFKGWATTPTGDPQETVDLYSSATPYAVTLYAIWEERNIEITINTTWTSDYDYDSYMMLSRPGSNDYVTAIYSTDNIKVTYNGKTYPLIIGEGDGRGSFNNKRFEKFTINTLGGKNYYYSIKNYDNAGVIGGDITVNITSNDGSVAGQTIHSTGRTNCVYWNVFAYKNGRIVPHNTCSDTMEYDY